MNRDGLIAVDGLPVIAVNRLGPIVADGAAAVVADLLAQVALGVNEDLLVARGVLEAQLVEAAAAGRAAVRIVALGLVCRAGVRAAGGAPL